MSEPGFQRLHVHQGDITTLAVDAIVNAANEALARGGGVCGAIFRVAGPGLDEECRAVGPCPTGEARITGGHGLPALHIIHAVGPVWHGGGAGEAELLAACYRNALNLAAENALATIAFPAISQGIFGFPAEQATDIAVATVAETLADHPGIEQVIFCCFSAESAALHRAAIARLWRPVKSRSWIGRAGSARYKTPRTARGRRRTRREAALGNGACFRRS